MNARWATSISLIRMTSGALMVTILSGCMTWQSLELAGAPPQPEELSERVRITREDSSQVVLEHAAVRGDSIAGVSDGGDAEAIALSDVRSLETWRLEPAFLFAPAVVVLVLFFTEFPLDDDLPPTVTSDGS